MSSKFNKDTLSQRIKTENNEEGVTLASTHIHTGRHTDTQVHTYTTHTQSFLKNDDDDDDDKD